MNATLATSTSQETAQCNLAGVPVILHISGALFLPSESMLVVADMHLEKSTSGARRGIFLPPYDSRITLNLLAQTVSKFMPKRILFLGDSFHDASAPSRLNSDCLTALDSLAARSELVWLTGNHDPEIPQSIAANCISEMFCSGLHFTHIPQENVPFAQVSGHLHPVAIFTGRGRSLRRRCFATDGRRMILPAFGAFTGGLSIRDKAFYNFFMPSQLITHVIGDQGIYALPATSLRK